MSSSPVSGFVTDGFEPVRAAFEKNLRRRGEIGAALVVRYQGRRVVDLWGGLRDAQSGDAWSANTMATVFSATKGVAAVAMAMACSRGWLELDAPVARYWPEFAQNGKNETTVRQLFSHQAGLCAIDASLDTRKLSDLDGLATILARQRPAWKSGTRHGYHAFSLGWYQNELLRRVDPIARTLGRFVQEEIFDCLGQSFYIGLPTDVTATDLARIVGFNALSGLMHMGSIPGALIFACLCPTTLTFRTLANPFMIDPAHLSKPGFRDVEIPSANGIGTARALAAMYDALIEGENVLGIRDTILAEITAAAVAPATGSMDVVLKTPTAYAMGFMKPSQGFSFGSSERSFGSPGVGGSFAFADPDKRLAYAYVTNRLMLHMFNDPREKSLRDACYDCLANNGAGLSG